MTYGETDIALGLLVCWTITACVYIGIIQNLDTGTAIFQQQNRCGDSLEADFGTLTIPSDGQMQIEPGRICIWTIFLPNSSKVKQNFTLLDIPGDDPNCEDSSITITVLNNRIPPEMAESYTFCNQNYPATDDFLMSGNSLAVVYRYPKNNTETKSGFSLNWEGVSSAPNPQITKSFYTTSTTGVIRYPIDGEEYPLNQGYIYTWVIQGSDADPNLRYDTNVVFVNLDECSINGGENPCLCNALIIYELSSNGSLHENARFCGNYKGIEVDGLGPDFIVGFFTNKEINESPVGNGRNTQSRDEIGFELIYQPRESLTSQVPPTQPTNRPTTTLSTRPTNKPTTHPTTTPTTRPTTQTTRPTPTPTTRPTTNSTTRPTTRRSTTTTCRPTTTARTTTVRTTTGRSTTRRTTTTRTTTRPTRPGCKTLDEEGVPTSSTPTTTTRRTFPIIGWPIPG